MDVSFLSPWSKTKSHFASALYYHPTPDLNYDHNFSPDCNPDKSNLDKSNNSTKSDHNFFVGSFSNNNTTSNDRQTLTIANNHQDACFDVIAPDNRLLLDLSLIDNGMRSISLTDSNNSTKMTTNLRNVQLVKNDKKKPRDPLRCIAFNKGVVNVPRVLKPFTPLLSYPLRYEKEFLLSLRNQMICRMPPDRFHPLEINEHPKKIKKELSEKKSQKVKEKKNGQKLKKKHSADDDDDDDDISFPSRRLTVPLLKLAYLSLLDGDEDEEEANSDDLNQDTQINQESRARRLETRQRQIDIGKNTDGYKNYVEKIPKDKRRKGEPQTPNKYQICSKRSWDGQIRKWRRMLHKYDPPHEESEDNQKETSNAQT